jgi:hypothetical protein
MRRRTIQGSVQERRGEHGGALIPYLAGLLVMILVAGLAVSSGVSAKSMFIVKEQSGAVASAVHQLWLSAVLSGERGYLDVGQNSYRVVLNGKELLSRSLSNGVMSERRRISISGNGVVSPASIEFRGTHARCRVFISLYGRTRMRCEVL